MNDQVGTREEKTARLEALYKSLEQLAATLPLAERPADIVPGEGNPESAVFFIGEAPGQQEALERRPFVGRSGKLLRKLLVKIDLPPEEVYIGNIVKVRPPENRDPSYEEIDAYRPFLDQEIEILEPKLIATLGRFSMAKFLPEARISSVHGRLHRVKWNGGNHFVLPLYHPAAALRSGSVLSAFEADLAKIPKILAWIEEHQGDKDLEEAVKQSIL